MEEFMVNPIILSVIFIAGIMLLLKSIHILYSGYILSLNSEILKYKQKTKEEN